MGALDTEATLLFYYYRWGLAGARPAFRAVRGVHSPKNASSLRIEIRSPIFERKMLKAGPRLLILQGLHGTCLAAHHRTASAAFFFILVLGRHVVSKLVVPPNQKNQPGRYHVSPKSAKRSINFCKIPVKRKTLNLVDVFVPCLLVVVMFRVYMPRFLHHFRPSCAVH
jgi:hypothetical protein